MTATQARRLLIIAFAISLLVHLLIALRVVSPFATPREEVQTVRIERARPLRVSRIPTPPPSTPPPVTPSPAPSASATAPASAKPSKPGEGRGVAPPGRGSPPPTAPPTPAPKPSPTLNCATNDMPAALATKPEMPDIAPDARGAGTSGTTRVRVSLNDRGVVQEANVVESSGNTSLDLVAVSMARGAHYTPATHECKPIASEYVFSARFSAW